MNIKTAMLAFITKLSSISMHLYREKKKKDKYSVEMFE